MASYLSLGKKKHDSKSRGDASRFMPDFFYMCGWMVVLLMAMMVSDAVATEKDNRQVRGPEPGGFSMTSQDPFGPSDDQSVADNGRSVHQMDTDTLFRRFMLPGTALLVFIVSAVLITIFLRGPNQGE